MKLVIASDIHGSATYARELFDRIDEEIPDRIILLGDFLYHGPRNDLPYGYAPKQVIPMLNAYASHIIAVRGNCDAEVDQSVLDFPCRDDFATIGDDSYTFFCTHGHIYSPKKKKKGQELPPMDAFLSGHTHIKTLDERDGILYVNPGSVSIPKDDSRSFAVYDKGGFTLKNLDDGNVIDTYQLS